jgi:hypothetical protein
MGLSGVGRVKPGRRFDKIGPPLSQNPALLILPLAARLLEAFGMAEGDLRRLLSMTCAAVRICSFKSFCPPLIEAGGGGLLGRTGVLVVPCARDLCDRHHSAPAQIVQKCNVKRDDLEEGRRLAAASRN